MRIADLSLSRLRCKLNIERVETFELISLILDAVAFAITAMGMCHGKPNVQNGGPKENVRSSFTLPALPAPSNLKRSAAPPDSAPPEPISRHLEVIEEAEHEQVIFHLF